MSHLIDQSAGGRRSEGSNDLFRLETIMDLINEMVFIADLEGFIVYINHAFIRKTGYESDEIIGKKLDEIVDIQQNSRGLLDSIRRIRSGDAVEYSLSIKSRHGNLLQVCVYVSAYCEELGNVSHYVCISRDLSREHELHKQLHELQRIEVLGNMAQGIAHGFSDILIKIDEQVLGLGGLLEKDSECKELVAGIQKASKHGHEMVSQIKAFVRKQDAYMSPIEIASVMRQAVRFVENTAADNIKVKSNLPDLSCAIMGITEEVHQVLINLMTNAIEAMSPSGGVLDVSLKEVDYAIGELHNIGSPKTVKCVRVKVSDNGIGIKPEDEDHIFEPYYTTKKSRDAIGMGLTVVRSTIERYRGQIKFYSAPGQGTTFEIYLPIHISDIYEHHDLLGPRGNGAKILLVDNETFVTQAGSNLLFGQGYQVKALNKPEDVVKLFEDSVEKFEILIIDMNLKGISGIELVRKLREMGVNLPVILTSTLGLMPQPWEIESLCVNRVLPKPCPARDLTTAIKNTLAKS
jgi:PAS domain S-box-containing protein